MHRVVSLLAVVVLVLLLALTFADTLTATVVRAVGGDTITVLDHIKQR